MQFDNKKFESNVAESLSTLDKLKNALNFNGATKGLETLNDSVKNVDMSVLSDSVDTVQAKFSALEVIGMTTLSNITNSVLNTGKNIVSALTIDPIKTGFNEYETQINAVQTILANTQSSSEQINQEMINSANKKAEEMTAIEKQSNKEQLEALKESHRKKLKEYEKSSEEQLKVVENTYKEQLKVVEQSHEQELEALEKSIKLETKALEQSHEENLEAYKNAYDEQIEITEEAYERQLEALESSIDAENRALKESHNAKLELYNQEYMAKLKAIDEERYNKLKAINDEIDAIKALTDAENKETKETEKKKKLEALQKKVDDAWDIEDRKEAEENLKNYKDELAREQLIEERQQKIDSLEDSKDAVYEEYALAKAKAQEEYETRKSQENSLYELSSQILKDQQSQKKKNLKEQYELSKKQIQSEYEQKVKQENNLYEQSSENMKEEQAQKKKNLQEQYEISKENIKNQYESSRDAIKQEKADMVDKYEAEVDAIKSNHKLILQNIEAQKEAQIKAAKDVKKVTKDTTIDDVNEALDELNEYADKTIYNFTEMTRNIGTFTAAGVDLKTSVSAIKGIANLGAISGSNSTQVSTAMYQLSQAIAAGKISLQDWNSVVNAGMGGKTFQDALIRTSEVLGTGATEAIEKYGSFRESLTEGGWLTKEVLLETLNHFTMLDTEANRAALSAKGYSQEQINAIVKMGETATDAATKVKTFTQLWDVLKESAQSGWSATWRIVIGDFEEAKETLTNFSDTLTYLIEESAKTRNAMLQDWKDLGGRTLLIKSVENVFRGVLNILKPIKEGFREIFPPTTGKQLYDFTKKVNDFTAKLQLNKTDSENLKITFKGLFALLDIGIQVFKAVTSGLIDLTGCISPVGSGFLNLSAGIGKYIVKIDEAIKNHNIFEKGIKTVTDAVRNFFKIFDFVFERFYNRTVQVGDSSSKMTNIVSSSLTSIEETFEKCKLIKLLEVLWNVTKEIGSGLVKTAGFIANNLTEKLGAMDFDKVLDVINTLSLGGIVLSITKFLKSVEKPFEELDDILGGAKEVLDEVRGCFEAYQTNLKAGVLLKIAAAIGILTVSIVTLSLIDSKKLSVAISAISMLFVELMGAMAIFDKFGTNAKNTVKSSAVMISMSIAITILAGAMQKISELDWEGLSKGLLGVIGLMGIIVPSAEILSKETGKLVKGAANLVILATALKVMASTCKDLSSLNFGELVISLTGVGVLLAEISLFLNKTDSNTKAISTSIGIIALASGLKILASACKDFGSLELTQLGVGLIGIGIALTEVTVALKYLPNNTLQLGTGLVVVAAALKIIADVVNKLGNLSWVEITRGLTAIGVALVEFSLGLKAMENGSSGSKALLIASSAILVLTPALLALGGMSWSEIGRGLTTIAGAFIILGIAGATLGPLSTSIISLAGAFALIGGGIALAGVGLIAAGAGLSSLAVGFTALTASVAAGATSLTTGLAVIVAGFVGLIPLVLQKIGEGIVEFAKAIGNGATAIGEAIVNVIKAACTILLESAPELTKTFAKVLLELLTVLAEYTPEIANKLFDIFVRTLDVLSERTPELVQAASKFLSAFLSSLFKELDKLSVDKIAVLSVCIAALLAALALLSAASSMLKESLVALGILAAIMAGITAIFLVLGSLPIESTLSIAASLSTVLLSISASMLIISKIPVSGALTTIANLAIVVAGITAIITAMGAIAQIPGVTWLVDEGGKFLEEIGNAIGGFAGGIVAGFLNGVSSSFPQIGADLSSFAINAKPFFSEIKNLDTTSVQGATALAETILLLTAANLINGLTSWLMGGHSIIQFGQDISEFGIYFKQYYETTKGIDGKVVEASANAAKSIAEFASAIPNSGGLISLFIGDNSLSAFAKELSEFGPSMKAYSDSISGLDPQIVTNSANTAKALAELATNLPNSGGLVSLFTGDNSLKSFGGELASFGEDFSKYASSVNGINTSHLSDVIEETNDLVDMADGMSKIDTKGMEVFAETLTELAKTGLNGFINAFDDAPDKVKRVVENMISGFTNTIHSYYNDFYNSGYYVVTGFSNAISDYSYLASNAARNMAISSVNAIRSELDINSPSKKMYKMGEYSGEGFVLALLEYARDAYNAGSKIADYAKNGLSEAIESIQNIIESDVEYQPTIRPVFDLSSIQNGTYRLNQMMRDFDGYSLSGSMEIAKDAIQLQHNNKINEESIISRVMDELRSILYSLNPNSSSTIENIFNITGEDPREIAKEVSRIIQKQVERRDALWG